MGLKAFLASFDGLSHSGHFGFWTEGVPPEMEVKLEFVFMKFQQGVSSEFIEQLPGIEIKSKANLSWDLFNGKSFQDDFQAHFSNKILIVNDKFVLNCFYQRVGQQK